MAYSTKPRASQRSSGFGSRATLVIGVSLQSAIGAYSGARALAMILSTAVVTVGDASFE
jgi:hypothetical protein